VRTLDNQQSAGGASQARLGIYAEQVTGSSSWGKTPRESVEQESARRGKAEVVAGCIELLRGRDADPDLIVALGGPPARWVMTGEPSGPPYWLRVWAARGLLYAWDDMALSSVETALSDDAWRVREMALRVVARQRLDALVETVIRLQDDPSSRVRTAASRSLMRLSGE
jgi:HEAT repeat protein